MNMFWLLLIVVVLLALFFLSPATQRRIKKGNYAVSVAHRCYEQADDERAAERNAIDAAIVYLKLHQPDYTQRDVRNFVHVIMSKYHQGRSC